METTFKAYKHIYKNQHRSPYRKWLLFFLLALIILLFLPWTQNIRARGQVTALRQEQRPQEVNTLIAGRIVQWYVKEGDYVKQGDTIVQLSEVKPDYLDPQLLQRTGEQLTSKQATLNYYQQKIAATETQINALGSGVQAKLEQVRYKLRQLQVKAQADSMEMVAAANDLRIAQLQYGRQRTMYDSGLVSLTQLEGRNIAYQNAIAKKTSAENKLLATRQEYMSTQIELNAVEQDYREKVSKAESDKYGSLSLLAGSQGDVAKLQNQFASYRIRNGMYYVLAPQSGQIVHARTSGIGAMLKEGDLLVNIVPDRIDFAVELFVRPVDLPLVAPGQPVRFIFDGFPALVFSGWPDASYGTFGGIVSAIESDVSSNGKFKVLIREDSAYRKWPPALRIGTGANGIALLKNVPVWYELWRNINSFPPDYYQPEKEKSK